MPESRVTLSEERRPAGPSLDETLKALGGGELDAAAFKKLATAVFQDSRSKAALKAHLESWDGVEATLGSKSKSRVVEGYCRYLLGDLARATEVLAAERKTVWGGYYYVRALLAAQRAEEAAAAVDEAFEKAPDEADLAFLRVEAYCRAGREEEAGRALDELESSYGERSAFHYARGRYCERISEYGQAIRSYRRAIDVDPGNANAHFRLAFCLDLYGAGDEEAIDQAIASYEQCLRVFPPHTNAVINLGILYEDRERYHDAIKCFESVLTFHPGHQRAKLFLEDARASTRMFYDKEEEKKADRHHQVLKIPVTDFELSVRSRNCLAKMNIVTLGDLIMKSEQELLAYKNFGETSLKEIKDMLGQKGLRLGQGLEVPGSSADEPRNPLEATASQDLLDKPIDVLELSVRSRRCMERLGIKTIRDVINKTEVQLMAAKNFGMTSLNEIKRKLSELGLRLRG